MFSILHISHRSISSRHHSDDIVNNIHRVLERVREIAQYSGRIIREIPIPHAFIP